MTPNQQTIFNLLQSLHGKVFADRDALEDAFFPYFGPLQPIFHGEGHRDLVDRLIAASWISVDRNGGYTVVLNGLPNSEQAAKPTAPTPTLEVSETVSESSEINYSELQMIIDVGTAPDGMLPASNFSMNEDVVRSLIQKGLVQLTHDLSEDERKHNDSMFKISVGGAKVMIDSGDLKGAIQTLEHAVTYSYKNANAQAVYSLTPKGQNVREKVGTINIKI